MGSRKSLQECSSRLLNASCWLRLEVAQRRGKIRKIWLRVFSIEWFTEKWPQRGRESEKERMEERGSLKKRAQGPLKPLVTASQVITHSCNLLVANSAA